MDNVAGHNVAGYIVAGHIVVEPGDRETYLAGCIGVVQAARQANGCLDFAVSADPVEPGRVNIYERWQSRAAVEEFRGSGPAEELGAAISEVVVSEYEVVQVRHLS